MSNITDLVKLKPSRTSLRIQSFSENECNGRHSVSVSHNKRRRDRPYKPVIVTPVSGAGPSDSTPHSETSSIMSVLTDPEHSTHSTDTRRTRRPPRRFANLYANVPLPPDVRDNAVTRDADYQPARWFARQYSVSAPESEAHDAAALVPTQEAIPSADNSNGASVHSESHKPTRCSRKKAKALNSASSHSTFVSPISSSQKREPESRSAEVSTSQRGKVPTSSRTLSRRHANASSEEESRAKCANTLVRPPPAKRRFLARLFDASEPFAGDLLNGAGASVCPPLPPSLPESSVVQISPNALLLRPSPKLHSPAARNSAPDVKDVKTAGVSHKRAAKTEDASSERRQLDVDAGVDAVDFVDSPHLVVSECLLPEVSSDDSDDGAAPRADGRAARSSRSDSDADSDADERTRVHVGRLVQPQLADVDVGERETRLRLLKPQLPAPLSPSTLRSRAATRKTMQAAAPWLCAFCHKSYGFRYELPGSELRVRPAGGESAGGAGDESVAAYSSLSELYGPYRVSLPDADRRALLAFGCTANGSTAQSSASAAASPSASLSPSLSPSQLNQNPLDCASLPQSATARSSQSSAKARVRPVEVWFHSECILWATNVYWNGKELIGLDEAIASALHLVSILAINSLHVSRQYNLFRIRALQYLSSLLI